MLFLEVSDILFLIRQFLRGFVCFLFQCLLEQMCQKSGTFLNPFSFLRLRVIFSMSLASLSESIFPLLRILSQTSLEYFSYSFTIVVSNIPIVIRFAAARILNFVHVSSLIPLMVLTSVSIEYYNTT